MRWPRFFSLLLVLLGLGFSAIAMADEPAKTQPNEAAQRLATKLVELDALQREVDQLRLELGRQPQLLFSIKTVEVNLTKMDNLGIDYAVAKEGLPNPASNNGVAESAEQLFCNKGILEALVQKNVARLVSDPTLVTVSGRPAHFCEGGEVPVGVGPDGNVTTKVLGTEVELLGTVTATNTIQLKIKASNSKLDHAHPVMINGRKQPGLRIQAIETAMEMKSGETRCLMGPTRERTETSLHEGGHTTSEVVRIQTIYLVTAELVEPFPQAPAMVRTDGQQAPQPAQSGYAESPGGGLRTTPASLQQVPMLDAIAINVDVLELSLTKLRNLGYFDGHYIQWMAALGLTDVEQSRKDQDAEPAKPAFALVEDLAKFEQNVKSMRDRDAVTIVSRPRLITLNGQSASIAVQSVGSRRKLYAFPAPAIGPLPPLAEEASLLLPNMNPAPNVAQQLFGFQIELQPKIVDENEIELTMEATLTEPMRTPNTARAGEALSIAKQTLRLKPGQSAIVPGDAFDRYVKSPGDRFIQEEVFRMMPLYVVTARAVTSMPQQSPGPAPATTAAEATTRK